MIDQFKNREKEQKKARAFGATFSLVFHALILMLFVITAAWNPPIEPPPSFGIEVNFGTDATGSGTTQSNARPNTNTSFDEAAPSKAVTSTPVESVQPVTPVPQTSTPTPTTNAPITGVEAESPESVAAVPTTPKREETRREEPKKVEPQKPAEVPNPATTLGGTGTSNQSKANNNGPGDRPGDAGDPSGSLNADAILGRTTGTGGSSLDMPGWKWESPPVANDNSRVTGRIVFEVRINNNGDVMSVSRVYSDIVDRSVINAYYEAVRKLSFYQENESAAAPMVTTGRITFVITSR
jgi:outer membrane biosynthesis protein TonB